MDHDYDRPPQRIEVAFEPSTQFDFDLVCQHLDGEPLEGASERALSALAVVFSSLFSKHPKVCRLHARSVGLKAIALLWVLNPKYVPGSPSLTELSKRLGVTLPYLSKLTGEMSRLAHWRNRSSMRVAEATKASVAARKQATTAASQPGSKPARSRKSFCRPLPGSGFTPPRTLHADESKTDVP